MNTLTTTSKIQSEVQALKNLHHACIEAALGVGSGDWHLHLKKEKVANLASAHEAILTEEHAHLDSAKTAWVLLKAILDLPMKTTPDQDAWAASLATEAADHLATMMVDLIAGAQYLDPESN